MLASLTRECFPSGMIRTMNLTVAVHATLIKSEDIESRHGLMAPQHMYVALLAQLVSACGQETDVVTAMRGMTGEAVLSHRRMFPQEWAALVRVTLITKLIGVAGLKHLAAFSAVRIMTGSASDFHANRLTIH